MRIINVTYQERRALCHALNTKDRFVDVNTADVIILNHEGTPVLAFRPTLDLAQPQKVDQ